MTNLKKTLAVVLAFAMILSMGAVSTFAAYSDVTAGTKVSEAVDILSGLNILTGFEDGTFKPEETVTRAQMAAIICRTLGYEDQAKSSMGSTVFNDVAADHWASGYVNVAQAQQIINGYGDGNFGPEDKVTYEQAVKMIVSALGYDLAAQAKGGYPTGYLAIASAEGITKSANGKVGDAATRGTIAVLVYNSLEVQLMDQSSWSTGSDGDKYAKIDETVLSKYLEVTKWEGVVTATPASLVVAAGTYDASKTAQAKIFGKYFYYYNDKIVEDYPVDASDNHIATTVYADKVDANPYLGKSVVAYIGEDEVTGNDTIFAIAENENKNEIKKISAVQLVESGEKYYNDTANTIGYKEIGSTRIKDLDVAGAKVLVNFVDKGTASNTAALATLLPRGGAVEFISNDADSDIEYIVATSYDREAVIETVENVNSVYTFDCYRGKLPKVDVEDEDSLVIIYKDGALATAADLAANDTVSYVELADGFEVFYASSATVTGVVDSYDESEKVVTIAGTDYKLSKISKLTAAKLSGEEGTFFLNIDGQIAHNETAPTAVGKYAYVVAAYDETSGVNAGSYLQVVLADGTVAEYEISKTAKLVDSENTVVQVSANDVDTDAEFKAYFAGLMTQQSPSTTYKATVANAKANKNLMVKFTVSNDKITKAKLLPAGTSAAGNTASKYDVESNSLGALNFDDTTVVFSVKQTTGVIDPDDIKVGAVADFFADEEDNYDVVAFDEEDSVYGAIVGFGISKPVTADSSVFVVASKKTTTIDNNDAYVLTGIRGGEEMTITVYNEDGYGSEDPANLVAGDVLLIAEPDADGIVSDIEQIADFTKGGSVTATATVAVDYTTGVSTLDQIHSGAGLVTDATANKFAINAVVRDDAVVDTCPGTGSCSSSCVDVAHQHAQKIAANTGISYRSAANYTLVNFSENFKNPEVTVEDGSEWTFDEAYLTYAYVRYVDGKLADVVVYRLGEYAATDIAVDKTSVADGSAVINVSYDAAATGTSLAITGTNVTPDNANAKFTASATTTVTVKVTKSGYADAVKTFDITVGA